MELFQKNINRLEEIYSTLINEDSDTSEEVELKIEIIDILSSLQASIITTKVDNKSFITLLEEVRTNTLNWNPQGNWFRDQKKLTDSIYDAIVQAKSILISLKENGNEASSLKQELNSIKSELNDLRSLMSELIKEKITSESSEGELISENLESEKTPETIETTQVQELEEEILQVKELPENRQVDVEEPKIDIQDKEEEVDESLSFATKTAEKLAQKEKLKGKTSSDLDKMKAILSEAEEETEKQIESFKRQLLEESEIEKKEESEIEEIKEDQLLEVQNSIQNETETEEVIEENLVKPSDVLKQQESLQSEAASSQDPYMQLLTLEAEKYRLEKAIEKNETDFQEGLKSKIEFDESIQIINKELVIIRDKIDTLRKQLTA